MLTNYVKKGTKPIPVIRVSQRLFNYIYETQKPIIEFCDNIEVWNNIRYGLWLKYKVYYFYNESIGASQRVRLIMNANKLIGTMLFAYDESLDQDYKKYIMGMVKGRLSGSHKDYEIISDPSINDYETLSLSPRTVKAQFSKIAKKCITQEQLQELVDKVGSEDRVKPFSYRQQVSPKIIKWYDCIYQDMHKAHSSFLIRTFKDYPEIIKWVENNNKLSAKFKCKGDLEKAHYYKDFPNLLVGCLGQSYKEGVNKGQPIKWLMDVNTRPLYNKCVNETYQKIRDYYDEIGSDIYSSLVYAQTDGLIVQHPDWNKVKVSDKVGEFGREQMDDSVVYTYACRTTNESTGYTIYQYFKQGKKVVVGDLPNELKKMVDLSKGQIVVFKAIKDEFGHKVYRDIKVSKIDTEEKK